MIAGKLLSLFCAAALAASGAAASAQADPHRAHPAATRQSPSAARDGISGNSVGRANAHGIVGGPAAARPAISSSINLKQRH